MRRIISIITAGLLLCSCIYEDMSYCPSYNGKGEDSTGVTKAVPVEFVISTTDTTKTRSSVSVSDVKVADINIYAYYDGMLEASVYEKSPQTVSLSLMNGRTYNLYALSNMGEIEGPVSEDELIAMDYSIKSISDMSGGLPMSWSQKSFTVSGSAPKASVTLMRLVSRIRFSIDKSALVGLSVTAVQLKQGALRATPFISQSKAASSSEVGDGDYATSSDISSLNSGNTVTFYALENCQGVLLPNNKEASSKVPEEIADKSALCTYLEMTASFSGKYEGVDVSSDNVKYRFYLGEDNCTDFNVIRNKDVKINLKVTEDRIFDESWRVSYGEDLPNIAYGLTNSKSSVSLNVGGSTTLSTTYYRTVDGVKDTETDVTSYAAWTSSNPSVATVSGGKITGVAAGTATITATYNGYKVTTAVTVNNVMGYGLVLSKSTLSIQAESTASLAVYYVTYTNGVETSRTDVTSSATWKTSMSSIATVSGGTVTGVSAGQAVVTASYRSYNKSCTVTVTKKPVTYTYALEVKLADSAINVGETTTATATYITYADGVKSSSKDVTSSATWSSGTSAVASVSGGTVTGKASGTSVIKATYNGYSASATVTVSDVVTHSLEVSISSSSIYVGENTSATASYITYTNGTRTSAKDVTASATWSSSSTTVATVSGGTVTGKSAGSATITAKYSGYSDDVTVSVSTKPVNYTYKLVVSLSDSSIDVGKTTTATASYITYADGVQTSSKNVTSSATWTSGTTQIATVSGGTVTGVKSGSAEIKATYNGYTGSAAVTVNDVLTYGLELSVTSATISVGNTKTIAANYITFTNGTRTSSKTVTSSASWSSSNPAVASVSGGSVTAKANGSATITATYNGYSATATVTVEDDITYDYQLSPTSTSVVNGRTTKMTAVRRTFTNGAQTNGEDYSSNFTWTSSNTSVATVGSNGVITGVGAGTATITAKYGGTTLTGTVTVTPNYTYELVLNKTSINMGKGRTETLIATFKTYADGVLESSKDVTSSATWSSSSSSVAGVNGGTITGNGVGSATITATYNGKSATCTVNVIGSPTLSLGWTSVDLKRGDVRTNAAIYNPNNGTASTNVTSSAVWTTSNSGVATVGGGQITAQGKGTCTITATYNGVSASCTVNVTENNTPGINAYVSNMSVQSVNVSGTSNYKLTLSLRFSDGTVVEDAPYTWSVTYAQNTSIATGTSGDAPIVYTGGGSTYVMAVTLTTKAYYYDANGNKRQHTTGTSFSHNTSWKP